MDELIQEFVSITNLDPNEAMRFLKMSNMNLQTALNYFFNKQDKAHKTNKKQSTGNQKEEDAFFQLQQGALKQKKLEKIIKDLKEEYSKPIEEQIKRVQESKENQKNNVQLGNTLNYLPSALYEEKAQKIKTEVNKKQTKDHSELKGIHDGMLQVQEDKYVSKNQVVQHISEERIPESVSNGYEKNQNNTEQSNGLEIEKLPIQLVGKKKSFDCLQFKEINFPLLLGKCQIKGNSSKAQNLSQLSTSTQLEIRLEIFKSSGKLGKGQKPKNDTVLRIYNQQEEIARLDRTQENILGPLLERKYITLKTFYSYSNKICNVFDPIRVVTEVYLKQNAVLNYEEIDDDGDVNEKIKVFQETRENFKNLFCLLNLELIQSTFINFDKNHKRIQESKVEEDEMKNNQQTKINFKLPNQLDPFQRQPKQLTLENSLKPLNKESIIATKTEPNQFKSPEISNEQNQSNDIDYEKLLNLKSCQNEDLELSKPKESFVSKLYEYQQQALTWMLMREGAIEQVNDKDHYRKLHPLWSEYQIGQEKVNLYFNPFSGQISSTFPSSSQKCKGGILADEMGLGKTIMLLALIHSNKPDRLGYERSGAKSNRNKPQRKANLTDFVKANNTKKSAKTIIIVPLTLVSQWEQEIKQHSKDKSISINVYYGTDRLRGDLSRYDIVLTTYGTVSHEFMSISRNQGVSSIFDYEWFRIILDEAHYIKGRTIQVAKAIYNLEGRFRWCSTGTPIQNKLDELFSLLHFIKLEPWSDYQWWNTFINKPFEQGDTTVFEMLQMIVKPVLLRRTKKSKNSSGQQIINLPNKVIMTHSIEFSEEERKIYDNLEMKSRQEVGGLLEKGILMQQYMKVFESLLRLRQVCDHPYLIFTRSDVKNIEQLEESIETFLLARRINKNKNQEDQYYELILDDSNQEMQVPVQNHNQSHAKLLNLQQIKNYKEEIIEKIKKNDIGDCPVCLEKIDDAVITSCLHILCRLCMMGVLANQHKCPTCRQYLDRDDFMTLPRESVFAIDLKDNYKSSAKIDKIVQILNEYIIGKNDKCVIFTQFLGMMDLLEYQFAINKIKFLRLDGKLNLQQRTNIIRQFNDDTSYQVFLISLKAGGVGLNLTKANHVIMTDPWWNPAVEDQAIERIYRIGQTKEVFVHKLIVQSSIEERILEMHQSKRQLFENTIATEEKKKEIRINLIRNLLQV